MRMFAYDERQCLFTWDTGLRRTRSVRGVRCGLIKTWMGDSDGELRGLVPYEVSISRITRAQDSTRAGLEEGCEELGDPLDQSQPLWRHV